MLGTIIQSGHTMPVFSKEARVIIIWLALWTCLKTSMLQRCLFLKCQLYCSFKIAL